MARGDEVVAREAPGTVAPTPESAATGNEATPEGHASLDAEVARLRVLVDELESWREATRDREAVPPPFPPGIPWLIGGAAFALGAMMGSAWARRRARRDRSLRF